MRARAIQVSVIAALGCALLTQGTFSQMPSGKDVVSPAAYASADPAARNVPFQIAVVLKIRPGFHVNAREKSEDYLIATDLKLDLPAGFTAGDVVYPKGMLHTFSFSKDKPLNIYEGSVTLRVPVTASSAAPLGAQHLPLRLRYQACSNEACLPPVTLPVDAEVNIAASGAKPSHPEIFAQR
ncbi:MAG TPA: protein-disulfide reductase DsbD N-terminal domain-containing protein [Candidatus Acidoferrum sp.]|nr:protein-disulfide reductase DsbD N-terminal domain-containing protein [Candidatus Acidoferrum sp.]